MSEAKRVYHMTTAEDIADCEKNLDEFEASVENCVTARLLPWGLLIGQRRERIAAAKERLAAQGAAESAQKLCFCTGGPSNHQSGCTEGFPSDLPDYDDYKKGSIAYS